MPLDRSTVIAGPAIITFGTHVFYSKSDISVACDWELAKVLSDMYGEIDARLLDRKAVVTFTPVGQITSDILAHLYPYLGAKIGDFIFTGTDATLEIWTVAGKKITFAAAAVTSMPPLKISAGETPFGSVTFTCINKNNTAWSDSASFCVITTASFTDPGSLASASVLQASAALSWAASGAWSSFTTEDGVSVEFDMGLTQKKCDAYGTYNYQISSLEVRAKCVPLGVTSGIAEAELISGPLFQNTGCVRGASVAGLSTAHDLVITAGAVPLLLTATLTKAGMVSSGMKFGSSVLRNGEVGWIATRTLTGSTVNALASLALTTA